MSLKQFGKNPKFHDFFMVQTNCYNFHDFSRPGIQILNSMTFYDRVNLAAV